MKDPLRPVVLPDIVQGRLLLSAMPGRFDPLSAFLLSATRAGVSVVASLVAPEEIACKSPAYAAARKACQLPFRLLDHPVRDYNAPDDPAAFAAFIKTLADALRDGETLALHCAAGIGRTGMAAHCLLRALDVAPSEAAIDYLRKACLDDNPSASRLKRTQCQHRSVRIASCRLAADKS